LQYSFGTLDVTFIGVVLNYMKTSGDALNLHQAVFCVYYCRIAYEFHRFQEQTINKQNIKQDLPVYTY